MSFPNHRIVLAVVAGLVLTTFTADLARLPYLPAAIDRIAYVRSGLSYLIDILGMMLLLRVVGGVLIARQWDAVGLNRPWAPAMLMGAVLFAPLLAVGLAFGSLADDLAGSSVFFLGVLAPLAEEVTYRGLALGILLAVAGWRFWPAALLPAVVFGLAHAAQGEGMAETALVVAITGAGGLFFGWLYFRFGRNLWPAIVMHIGMNVMWNLFAFGDNAVGDVLGNVLRAASLVGAIAFAVWGRGWLERTTGTQAPD